MKRNDLALLRQQIAALSGNIDVKFEILEKFWFHGSLSVPRLQGLLTQTVREGTLYSYINELEGAHLVHVADAKSWPREYAVTDKGVSELFSGSLREPPKIRWIKNEIAEWSEERMIADLQKELGLTFEEAANVRDMTLWLARRLGLDSIYRNTARDLMCEALYLIGEHSTKEADKARYHSLADLFRGIGYPRKEYLRYSKLLSKDGIHTRPPEELTLISLMAQSLTAPLRHAYFGKMIYIHGLAKIDKPFTINHDLRWFFLYGLRSRYHEKDPPDDLRSALRMMSLVLSMCQIEVAGSQTIDHWNTFLSPYLGTYAKSTEKTLTNEIESFVSDIMELHSTRPKDPVYSTLVLDLMRPTPPLGNPVRFGEILKGSFDDFAQKEDETTHCTRTLLAAMSKAIKKTNGLFSYPKIHLKINEKWLKDPDLDVLRELLEIISDSGESIYFVNMDHPINQSYNVAYSSELQRISYQSDDENHRRSIGTFVSIHLPSLMKQNSDVTNVSDPRERVVAQVKTLAQEIVSFHEKKMLAMKDHQLHGDLEILGMKSPSSSPYLSLDDSHVNLGLCGLSQYLNVQNKNFADNFKELESLLLTIEDSLNQLTANGITVQLSQTPRRSGAFMHFINQHTVPYEYANLTPCDDPEQLRHEARLQELLKGGAVCRRYVPRTRLREMWQTNELDGLCEVLQQLMKHVAFFQILPEPKPVL